MKKRRLAKKFLEELAIVPIVARACRKFNLTRQSVSRWIKEDPEFSRLYYEALDMGDQSVNDMAKNCIISKINEGDPKAAMYWLNNKERSFMKPRAPVQPEIPKTDEIDSIKIVQITRCADCKKEEDKQPLLGNPAPIKDDIP